MNEFSYHGNVFCSQKLTTKRTEFTTALFSRLWAASCPLLEEVLQVFEDAADVLDEVIYVLNVVEEVLEEVVYILEKVVEAL